MRKLACLTIVIVAGLSAGALAANLSITQKGRLFSSESVTIKKGDSITFVNDGSRGISTSGDLVVRLYDGPSMAINHARSAHAALNDARLLMQRGLSGSEPE